MPRGSRWDVRTSRGSAASMPKWPSMSGATATRRTLGMYLADDDPYRVCDEAFLIWFHAGSDPIQVELPDGPWAETYTVIAHTGPDGELPSEKIEAGDRGPSRSAGLVTVVVLAECEP